jgi:hypothetical protein
MAQKERDAPGAQPYGAFTQQELKDAIQVKWPAADYLRRARYLCSRLQSTEEGYASFLNRRGPAKHLCDEMVPIGYLCEYFFERNWPSSEIQLVLGNQKHDAVVTNAAVLQGMPTYIEVTGLDPTDSHKLRQDLAKKGVAKEVFREQERVHELAERLQKAIVDKSENGYPPGTLLLIFLKTNERLNSWMDVIVKVSELYYNELSRFDRVIVMNQHGLDLDFQPAKASPYSDARAPAAGPRLP